MNLRRVSTIAAALLAFALGGCTTYERYFEMTFFVTSTGNGKGANFGGLEGADQHCLRKRWEPDTAPGART